MTNIDVIYCNGCSHSAGGGMEPNRIMDDSKTNIRDFYKSKYNAYNGCCGC